MIIIKSPGWSVANNVYLFKFVGNHGESLKDGIRGSCDGDDSLWTVPLWDVDASSTL